MWNDNKEYKAMVYLLWCAIHDRQPDAGVLDGTDGNTLLKMCIAHKVVAFINKAVRCVDDSVFSASLKEQFSKEEMKALRVSILFEAEKEKVFAGLEENKIWYLPLKGCIVRDYYPEPNLRQMGDIDVLIGEEDAEKIRVMMTKLGYKCKSFGIIHHDEYYKAPFYNYEMHRALFMDTDERWVNYYSNVREKLVLKNGKAYEYVFTKEDFYLYFFMHAFKHFTGSGTGIRTLVDLYLYMSQCDLDFAYIEQETDKLGTKQEEKRFRELTMKVFSPESGGLDMTLTNEEDETLYLLLVASVYGGMSLRVRSNMQKAMKGKKGKNSKFRYVIRRVFQVPERYSRMYPRLYKHSLTRPLLVFVRFSHGLNGQKLKTLRKEWSILKKMK